MDRKYWEKIAPGYNEEIFDVLQNDRKGIIRSAIKKISSPSKTVIDAGCAVGKWLPALSPLFKKVIAADISVKNLVIAGKTYPDLTNIEYLRLDLSRGKIKLPACDVAICINAILTDSLKKRNIFFHNLSSCLTKDGYLILVVPSLESWLLTRITQHRWKIDKNLFKEKLTGKEAIKRYKNIQQGNAEIDSVATKHYLREELILLLAKENLTLQACKKIEYPWTTEFRKSPKWLKQVHPWDWMVMAQKVK
jgi:2-polyprenyl-3-methyl-5-hydroxy-6-metoxy-1,4-benzoquinol methylase